jgi:CheY-like chemotaxis protein/KaiC/GvpD/RAD55 family RecA-like ATPase
MTKILVADDESNILTLLEIILRDVATEIITAENGEMAIQKAFIEKPDLIISDVVMPKKNGFEVCRAVRNHSELNNIPIILLSALGDEYNKLTGFEEGANDYIVKPFNVEDLKNRVNTLLTRYMNEKKAVNRPELHTKVSTDESLISTGISKLDEQLYGGLPLGSNILITGHVGSGKSSFARQFLAKNLMNNAQSLVVAIDDDPKKIRLTLSDLLEKPTQVYEDKVQLRFIDAYSWSALTPPDDEHYMVSGSLELNQLSGIISDASFELGHSIQEKKGGCRVIDSISSLLIHFELSVVQRFLNQIARTSLAFGGVTTLFIFEEGTVDETILNNIKYIMDGVIEFKKENQERKARVASMKWAKYNHTWVTV